MMTNEFKIEPQPEYDALNAFDAENNVEPPRRIAERIAHKNRVRKTHPMVDDISHALEDAMRIGEKRGKFLPDS